MDPLSGEGIYPAIKSGLLAGEVIWESLAASGHLEMYQGRLEQALWREQETSALLAKLFSLTPGLLCQGGWHAARGLGSSLAGCSGENGHIPTCDADWAPSL